MSSSEPARRRRYRLAITALLLAACSPPVRQFDLVDQPLTCDDANHLAYRTLEAMRFGVGEFQPAAAGTRGVIKASRTRGSDETQAVTVTIDCAPGGVTILASDDAQWLEQMEFKRAFHHAFINVRNMRDAQADLDAQNLAGTAPASQQRRDLKVVVEPKRGQAAKLDFTLDLAAAGVLPVRIEVTNLTPRTYTLAPDDIRLSRIDRERIAPLSARQAAERVAGTRVKGAPLTPMTTEAIADALAQHLFDATEIAPGAAREGYLYFPLAQYDSARLLFTDRDTQEDEGVRVEF